MAMITKKILASQIAVELQIGDREALRMIDAVIGAIEDTLMSDNKVVLKGFGTFYVKKRKRYKKHGSYFRVYFRPHGSFLKRLRVLNVTRYKIDQETHDRVCKSLVKTLGLEE